MEHDSSLIDQNLEKKLDLYLLKKPKCTFIRLVHFIYILFIKLSSLELKVPIDCEYFHSLEANIHYFSGMKFEMNESYQKT